MIDDHAWLGGSIGCVTSEVERPRPSEWAEQNRYLPQGVSRSPGLYSFALTPFAREIVDCMDIYNPTRELTLMKGAQVGATTMAENAMGYFIGCVKNRGMMFVTSNDSLAKIRMDKNVVPMIEQSGLSDRIMSTEELSSRKQGRTAKTMSWLGGGWLLMQGCNSAGMLRSNPFSILIQDERDSYPISVGNDGDPGLLSEKRTSNFEETRKIFRLSTPLVKKTSGIYREYRRGDQRKYYVPCRNCKEYQFLEFSKFNEDGVSYGLTFEHKEGRLVYGTTRYLCKFCQFPHTNAHKTDMFAAGEWKGTAVSVSPSVRSYHLPSLYSPSMFSSWEMIASKWCNAWDVEHNRSKGDEMVQEFYNNELGWPWEVRGKTLTLDTLAMHRRGAYRLGTLPGDYIHERTGRSAGVLICTVDVHMRSLAVSVVAWVRGERSFLVDHWKLEGDVEIADDPATWGVLEKIIETTYSDGRGRNYPITLTALDSGYSQAMVTEFCRTHDRCIPIKGQATIADRMQKEFRPIKFKNGAMGYAITVDYYKDWWSNRLRKQWDGVGDIPEGTFSAPGNITDAVLMELAGETKIPNINKKTGNRTGWTWNRKHSGVANELWDLLVYSRCALDMLCASICIDTLGMKEASLDDFFGIAEDRALYWRESSDVLT